MSERRYLDFELALEEQAGGEYLVRVIDSPVGQSRSTFTQPFAPGELAQLMEQLTPEGRAPGRGGETAARTAARAIGSRLFDAVFSGPVETCYRRSLDEAERAGQGLRIRLRLADAPSLTQLPWEYLYSSASGRFVALSSWSPLVRYLDLPRGVTALRVEPPIRILTMIASPSDYPALNTEEEWVRLRDSMGDLISAGKVELHRMESGSLSALQRALLVRQYHVFHFIGHGVFDEPSGDGVLMLEGDNGRGRMVPGRDLGVILHDHRSMRLALLNACEGGRASATDPFSGTAQSLVRSGIPAVVAMQFEISDDAALTFAHAFYAGVALGLPIDASVTEARKAVFSEGYDPEWGTPVVYMRSPDGHIFDIPDAASTVSARPGAQDPSANAGDAQHVPADGIGGQRVQTGDGVVIRDLDPAALRVVEEIDALPAAASPQEGSGIDTTAAPRHREAAMAGIDALLNELPSGSDQATEVIAFEQSASRLSRIDLLLKKAALLQADADQLIFDSPGGGNRKPGDAWEVGSFQQDMNWQAYVRKLQEAVALLDEALQLDETNAEVLLQLAKLHMQLTPDDPSEEQRLLYRVKRLLESPRNDLERFHLAQATYLLAISHEPIQREAVAQARQVFASLGRDEWVQMCDGQLQTSSAWPYHTPGHQAAGSAGFSPVGSWQIDVADGFGTQMHVQFAPDMSFQATQRNAMGAQLQGYGQWAWMPAMHMLEMQGIANGVQPFMLAIQVQSHVPPGWLGLGSDGLVYTMTPI
jgi:hypothetical protein